MAVRIEILELRGGMTNQRVTNINMEDETEASKFCERFNKFNVPTAKADQATKRYLFARSLGQVPRGYDSGPF